MQTKYDTSAIDADFKAYRRDKWLNLLQSTGLVVGALVLTYWGVLATLDGLLF